MIHFIVENHVIFYLMAMFTVAGIVSKLLVSQTYRRLCRQAGRMAATEHALLKNIRMRFEEAEGFSNGVYNVDAFVDKYVYEHKVCGIYLFTWEKVCGQSCAMVVIISVFSSIAGYYLKCGQRWILSTLMAGGLCAVVLISMEFLFREEDRRLYLVAQIRDYLENHLRRRLEAERVRMAGDNRQAKLRPIAGNGAKKTEKAAKPVRDQAESLREIGAVDEKVIDDILKEYIF